MKTRTLGLLFAVLLGAVVGAGGCVDDRVPIQIQHVCAPPTDCVFDSGCAQFIGYVALDRALNTTGRMDVYLQVLNQLEANDDPAIGRLNTNDAHVDEIVVVYDGLVSGEASYGASNFVEATEVTAVKVPLTIGGTSAGEVLVRIRLRGYFEDGTRFETGEFPISITVCASGCGVNGTLCPTGTCPPSRTGMSPLVCAE